jgi:flagellar biosynthesis protein FlhG
VQQGQWKADMTVSIVVASGKGGVGKTSVSVNLGLCFARQGRRTILFDADFGMANAHILIGANPKRFIMDVLDGSSSMTDILCDAPHGMKFISGGSGLLDMLNVEKTTRYQTIRMVDELHDEAEVLIVDAPAGASDNSIAFVGAADHVVVVLVGEPTSFLDAYSLIKAANIESNVQNFNIVVNMARNAGEARAHFDKFNATVGRFLDVNLKFAGHLPLSDRMRRAIVQRRPIGMESSQLPENRSFMAMSKAVLESPKNLHAGIRFFSENEAAIAGT